MLMPDDQDDDEHDGGAVPAHGAHPGSVPPVTGTLTAGAATRGRRCGTATPASAGDGFGRRLLGRRHGWSLAESSSMRTAG